VEKILKLPRFFKEKPAIEDSYGIVQFGTDILDIDDWNVETNRFIIEEDIENITKNCPIVSTALQIVKETATTFEEPSKVGPIIINGSDRLKRIVSDLFSRTDLYKKIGAITYNTLKYGNYFVQIEYNKEMNKIVNIKLITAPRTIIRNEDDFGNLMDAEDVTAFTQKKNGSVVAKFKPWEIHHFRFPYDGKKYAEPQLLPMTKIWNGYRLLRNQQFAFRSQMSPITRVHRVPVPSQLGADGIKKALKDYSDAVGISRYGTVNTAGDLKLSSRGKVPIDLFIPAIFTPDGKVVETNIRLLNLTQDSFNMDEMNFWANHIFTRLRTPPKMLFWDFSHSKISDGGTDPETAQLRRFAASLMEEVVSGIRRIIDIELFVNGIMPSDEEYQIYYPNISTLADLVRARSGALAAQSVLMAGQAGIDKKWWLRVILGVEEKELESLEINEDPKGFENASYKDIDAI
jgi:hypothetical protein